MPKIVILIAVSKLVDIVEIGFDKDSVEVDTVVLDVDTCLVEKDVSGDVAIDEEVFKLEVETLIVVVDFVVVAGFAVVMADDLWDVPGIEKGLVDDEE